MPYEVPYLHPAVVHFPIALLGLGGAVALVYAAVGRAFWREAALLLCLVGAVGAVAATRTGEALEEAVEGEPMAELFLADHERYGEWTQWASLLAVAALGGVTVWRRRIAPRHATRPDPLGVRVLAALPAVAAAGLAVQAGRLGGLMVWGVPAVP